VFFFVVVVIVVEFVSLVVMVVVWVVWISPSPSQRGSVFVSFVCKRGC